MMKYVTLLYTKMSLHTSSLEIVSYFVHLYSIGFTSIFDKNTIFPSIPTRFSATVGSLPMNPPGPMEKPVCPSVDPPSHYGFQNMAVMA